MSYRAGIGGSLAKRFDVQGPLEPHLFCDRCGLVKLCTTRRSFAPMWLLNNKAPPGWKLIRYEDPATGTIHREDYCPACKTKVGA